MTKTKTRLKITIGRKDVEALMYAYQTASEQMPALMTEDTREHDELLHDHAREMQDMLQTLCRKQGQNTFTINLRLSEVRAIQQLWQYAFALTLYYVEAVRRFCTLVDKEAAYADM